VVVIDECHVPAGMSRPAAARTGTCAGGLPACRDEPSEVAAAYDTYEWPPCLQG